MRSPLRAAINQPPNEPNANKEITSPLPPPGHPPRQGLESAHCGPAPRRPLDTPPSRPFRISDQQGPSFQNRQPPSPRIHTSMITHPRLNPQDLEAAFRRCLDRKKVPHQSGGANVRFPGLTLAAKELGIHRGHLHRVLIGERKSPSLSARWNAWLMSNPQFAALYPSR